MTQLFFFDRDFDDELENETRSAKAPSVGQSRPALTEAELDAIRAEAFAAGKAEGIAEATAETEARMKADTNNLLAASLTNLLPEIQSLKESRQAHHNQLEADLMRLVHSLAEKTLPEIFTAFSTKRVLAFCRRALAMAEGQAGLELRLPEAVFAQIETALSAATTSAGAPVKLTKDPDLSPGQVLALWDQGRAEYALDRLHGDLLAALTQISPKSIEDRT